MDVQKSFEMSNKELFTFEKYEIWMVELPGIIGFQLFCRFLKSTTTKLNTICFWQRKAKAPSGEFHFASYFSFRPFIYTHNHGIRTLNKAFFHWNSQTLGLGQTIWVDKFGEFGVFPANLSAPILVLWVPCFLKINHYF